MENYVHVPLGTNLDAGTFDSKTGWVRFGAKHNDIYPRIGDLIRYHLNFEPRKSVSRAINKAEEDKKEANQRGISIEALYEERKAAKEARAKAG